MNVSAQEILAAIVFGLAILHTFSVKIFQHQATKHPEGSILENLFHLLGEIEIVFGFWVLILMGITALFFHPTTALGLVESRDFTEPLFVFAIMSVSATRPVVELTTRLIAFVSRAIPLKKTSAFLFATLAIGPLLGSLITEPAAMTVTALILRDHFFQPERSERFKYRLLGTLFVNISIGGVLTHFAAPPVLMVARVWQWDSFHMLKNFGWKAAIVCCITAALVVHLNRNELRDANLNTDLKRIRSTSPWWLSFLHIGALIAIVFAAHHPALFLGILFLFLGLARITQEYQDELKLKESLLVGFFLAGLVVLGGLQAWWLKPLVSGLSSATLFLGATFLTAFTDNAALTYLGSQIPDLPESIQYALVAGAVAGGGLTVIANAPNPAGFSILSERFGPEGISPMRLLISALIPTGIAMGFFWFLQ